MSVGTLSDTENVTAAARFFALNSKRRQVSLLKISKETHIQIERVHEILSTSKIGEIETFDNTFADAVFFLNPEQTLSHDGMFQTLESGQLSQTQKSQAQQGEKSTTGGSESKTSPCDFIPFDPIFPPPGQ